MDYTQVLQLLFNALWYLIPLAILAAVIKSPWFEDKTEEAFVNLSAKLFLDKARYHPIKNVTLPTEDGTTQIDYIIVARYTEAAPQPSLPVLQESEDNTKPVGLERRPALFASGFRGQKQLHDADASERYLLAALCKTRERRVECAFVESYV